MTKKNLMPTIVLVIICLVTALLMGAVNLLTSPIINDRNDKAIRASLEKALPGGQFNTEPDELKENAPETISRVYTATNGKGAVVVLVTKKGYTKKDIGITVGIDTDGKITGLEITQNEESIVPTELKPGGSYGKHYVGAGADDIVELVTGATVAFTESAIKNAVNDAFLYLGFAEEKPELPREESEIFDFVKALYGAGAEKLESFTPENGNYVKRVYKERDKNAYIAYAFAYSQYGTPEFEFLTYVDENGTVKAMYKILWKVSDPLPSVPSYKPPSEDAVNAFFESFVGKNTNTISAVEIETGATNTSGRVRDAAFEALEIAFPETPNYAARIIGIAGIVLGIVSFVAFMLISKKRSAAKNEKQ